MAGLRERTGLVWTGPVLLALAALLAALAGRGKAGAIPLLILLSAVDLGTYGLSYAVYPGAEDFQHYVAAVAAPPGPAGGRVALDLMPANRPGLHVGDQVLLSGWNRIDGYAGLAPARRLDYRQTAALRVAGVDWVAAAANLADRGGLGAVHGDWIKVQDPLPRARLVCRAVATTDPARDIGAIPLESTALVEQPVALPTGHSGSVKILAERPARFAWRSMRRLGNCSSSRKALIRAGRRRRCRPARAAASCGRL